MPSPTTSSGRSCSPASAAPRPELWADRAVALAPVGPRTAQELWTRLPRRGPDRRVAGRPGLRPGRARGPRRQGRPGSRRIRRCSLARLQPGPRSARRPRAGARRPRAAGARYRLRRRQAGPAGAAAARRPPSRLREPPPRLASPPLARASSRRPLVMAVREAAGRTNRSSSQRVTVLASTSAGRCAVMTTTRSFAGTTAASCPYRPAMYA